MKDRKQSAKTRWRRPGRETPSKLMARDAKARDAELKEPEAA